MNAITVNRYFDHYNTIGLEGSEPVEHVLAMCEDFEMDLLGKGSSMDDALYAEECYNAQVKFDQLSEYYPPMGHNCTCHSNPGVYCPCCGPYHVG